MVFGFKHGNFKNLPKLHFRVTKKDTSLPFHFHVLYLFKSWSNLGFDQDSNGHKKFKKIKTKHIVFWCHIASIQVDKQARSRHIQTRKFMYLPPNPKLYLMKSSTKRCRFGFQTWKFQKPFQKLHFGVNKKSSTKRSRFHVLNLLKSWSNLGFDQDSNGHKI